MACKIRAVTLSVILCASCNRWPDIIDNHCYVVGNQRIDVDKHNYIFIVESLNNK